MSVFDLFFDSIGKAVSAMQGFYIAPGISLFNIFIALTISSIIIVALLNVVRVGATRTIRNSTRKKGRKQ